MTSPKTPESKEGGIWYKDTSARESDVAKVNGAVRNLGNLTLRVIRDINESQEIVFGLVTTRFREMYPDASVADIAKAASTEAANFVREMEPSEANSHDLRRLIRVDSIDGSPVLPYTIAEEIKFRVKPGLDQAPVTTEEVTYATLRPADPSTLLD